MSRDYDKLNKFTRAHKSKRKRKPRNEWENRKIKTNQRQKDWNLIAKQAKQREKFDWSLGQDYDYYHDVE